MHISTNPKTLKVEILDTVTHDEIAGMSEVVTFGQLADGEKLLFTWLNTYIRTIVLGNCYTLKFTVTPPDANVRRSSTLEFF